jgi:hypothetical protein
VRDLVVTDITSGATNGWGERPIWTPRNQTGRIPGILRAKGDSPPWRAYSEDENTGRLVPDRTWSFPAPVPMAETERGCARLIRRDTMLVEADTP